LVFQATHALSRGGRGQSDEPPEVGEAHAAISLEVAYDLTVNRVHGFRFHLKKTSMHYF